MKTKKLDRRTVLRGLMGGAAVAIGLPALEIFLNDNGTAYAGADSFPKRFGIFFWGNGNLPDKWVPAGNGPEWELTEQLMPLAAVKEHITVVSGMKVATGNSVPHGSGPVGMLSGAPYPIGDETTFAVPSIDQVIANEIGKDSRFKSIEVGVQPDAYSLSYNGPHSVNPPETSPAALFKRIFGPGFVLPGQNTTPDPKLALRQSVLDAVKSDAERLQQKLGSADKARLEQHLEGVRGLEKQIQKMQENPPSLEACLVPAEPKPEYPEVDGRPPLSEISRVMSDIIVMALACDQTRVFSHWFSSPVNNTLYPDATAGHHQLTHDEPDPQPQVNSIVLYTMTELAYLVNALNAVKEGESTLLDHMALLVTSDVSYGRAHSIEEYPILIAGSANGALKKGVHYKSPASENTSKVLLTLSRAMGLVFDSYGQGAGLVNSSLSAIEV
ncbi:MAG: DUF1552 domain-containing protein [Polyangiaceae bacterium]|nr:DUF1552 domain-containing protein [Polyangiaceae bacterium]